MEKKRCPNCNKEIDIMEQMCPHCGEMIFDEVIEVKEVPEEYYEETLDDIISEENIIIRSIVKGVANVVKKTKELGPFINKKMGAIFIKAKKVVSEFFTKKVPAIGKVFVNKTKIYKLKPYMTYEKLLGVAIVISSVCLVSLCLKNVLYLDKESKVSQVNNKSTYTNVKKIYNGEGEMNLDLTDGTIVYTYKNQKIGDIEDCTVSYKVNPNTNKVSEIYWSYKKSLIKNMQMRNYLEVNYGKPSIKNSKSFWSYNGEEYSYFFSNGVYDSDIEYVNIRYIKNAPTREEIEEYSSENIESDEEIKDKESDKKDREDTSDKNDKESDKKDSKDKSDKDDKETEKKDSKDKSDKDDKETDEKDSKDKSDKDDKETEKKDSKDKSDRDDKESDKKDSENTSDKKDKDEESDKKK